MEKIVNVDGVEYLVKEPKYKQIKAVKGLSSEEQVEKLLLGCVYKGDALAFASLEQLEELPISTINEIADAFEDITKKK
jgi:hypothetical protein